MERPQFVKLNLCGVNFQGRNLKNVIFRGCDLREADFRNADLESVEFLYCDIRGTNFSTANMDDVLLTDSVYSETPCHDEAEQQRQDERTRQILEEGEKLYYQNNK